MADERLSYDELKIERDTKHQELLAWRRVASERAQEASILRQEREGLQERIAALEVALRQALEVAEREAEVARLSEQGMAEIDRLKAVLGD